MATYLRLFSDADGRARFEECELALSPENPGRGQLSMSEPFAATAALFVRAPAGGGHPEHPESRRQLAIVLSGEVEVTASGETRVGRPGDVLLIEDTTGVGHASRTSSGFTAIMIVLDDPPSGTQ